MHITENEDGSFTATPDDFEECDSAHDQGDDCWYTGADLRVSYDVAGLDGRYGFSVCLEHLETSLEDLYDPRRWPYTVSRVVVSEVPGA